MNKLLLLVLVTLAAWLCSVIGWLLCRKRHKDFGLWSQNEGLIILIVAWVVLVGIGVRLGWIPMRPD